MIGKKSKENNNLTNDKSLLKAKNNSFMNYFGFRKYNSTIAKEIIGGISSFLAIIYILSVEPSMLSGLEANNLDDAVGLKASLFLSTAIIIAIFTLLMGLIANVPIVLAPAMGVNAVFTYNIAGSIGYEAGCIATFISGLLLLIISSTKIRVQIINSIPKSIKLSITSSIGLLITYIGFNQMHLFEQYNGLPVASLSNFKTYYPAILIGISVFFISLILHFKNIVGSTIIAMMSMFVIALVFANIFTKSDIIDGVDGAFTSAKWNGWSYDGFDKFGINIGNVFKEFKNEKMWSNITFYEGIFVFLMLTFFDASSTIDSACSTLFEARNEEGSNKVLIKAMIVDSSSSLAGGLIGLSPNTAFAESFVGIKQGAKTGFAAVVISALTLIAIPLYPIFIMIPQCVTGGATAFVGVLIAGEMKKIDWSVPEYHVAAILTMVITTVTFNITNGVAIGLIAYVLVCASTKKIKEIKPIIWALFTLFVSYFIIFTFIQ